MTISERLTSVVEQLGYVGSAGFVDGVEIEAGAVDYVWRDLSQKARVDAAYFRGAVPLVAFSHLESREQLGEVHRRLWNLGRVPVLIATTPDETFVVDCNALPLRGAPPVIAEAAVDPEILRADFARFAVEHGRFSRPRTNGHEPSRVDQHLLRNLRLLRSELIRAGTRPADVEPLLGRSILARYLEDRSILTPEHLGKLGLEGSLMQTLLVLAGETAPVLSR